MATSTRIEWTDITWNPVTGCTKISQGCKHCYAERMARRLQAMGQSKYRRGFAVTLHPDALDQPRQWSTPRLVFVNSMSDLFHERVPTEFIREVFGVMVACPRHTFQVLTKRSSRARAVCRQLPWPKHIWMGVSVEDASALHRVDDLRAIPAAVRFLSIEPLLGPLDGLSVEGIDWVIVGGESGPGARPMRAEWVDSIYQSCVEAGVPFFFKQWGGVRKRQKGRTLRGRTFDEMPIPRSRWLALAKSA